MFRRVVRTYVLAGGGFRYVEGGLRGRLLMDMFDNESRILSRVHRPSRDTGQEQGQRFYILQGFCPDRSLMLNIKE